MLLSQCLSSKITVFYLLVPAQRFAQKHQFSACFSFLFFPPTAARRTYFQPFGQKTALTGLNARW